VSDLQLLTLLSVLMVAFFVALAWTLYAVYRFNRTLRELHVMVNSHRDVLHNQNECILMIDNNFVALADYLAKQWASQTPPAPMFIPGDSNVKH